MKDRADLRLLTVPEAARLLGVRWQTVKDWIDDGTLRSVEVGNRHRLSIRAVLALHERLAGDDPGRGVKPDGECLRRGEWAVMTVPLDACAHLVTEHHYAGGGANTATFRHGLFRDLLGCVGVAWWLPPTKPAAQANFPEGDWRRVLSLSRLVVAPGVPKNAATFLIGQSIRLIRASGAWDCLLTYADGWQGHTGAIYRATNWEYLGETDAEPTYVDATGRMVARKAGPRTRTHAEMVALGCSVAGRFPKHRYRMVLRTPQLAAAVAS